MARHTLKPNYDWNTAGEEIYAPSLPVGLSIPVIVIVFVVFWPLAIYLIWKRTDIKRINFNGGKAIEGIGWFLAICGFLGILGMLGVLSDSADFSGSSAYSMVTLFGGGIALIISGKATKRLVRRYKKYADIVTDQGTTSIEEIAAAMPVSRDTAVKDLQKMINKGLFAGASIDPARSEIILPGTYAGACANDRENVRDGSVAQKGQEIAVTCKNCGASNKVGKNSVGVCEFCGSPISGA